MPGTSKHVAAVMSALRFRSPDLGPVQKLNDAEWRDVLSFCDVMHLTLAFERAARSVLPESVRERIEGNKADNAARFGHIQRHYREIREAFSACNIEHIILKGFAQWPGLIDPHWRMQSDIDLYVLMKDAYNARDAIAGVGYEALSGFENRPSDHLPPMVRPNGWQWRGNFFDPEMPPGIEVHFRLWGREVLRFGPHHLDPFWTRRRFYDFQGFRFPTLDRADGLGFACLHVLRHILSDAVLTHHVYEVAWFLHTQASKEDFWLRWRNLHDDDLRRIQAVCFQFAKLWFDCDLSAEAQEEIARLPIPVRTWFDRYATSPLLAIFEPNKDALWLHVSLLESFREKRAIIAGRLLPTHKPPIENAASRDFTPDGQPLKRWLTGARANYVAYVASRVGFHIRTMVPTLWRGVRWWGAARNPGREFWKFYIAAFFFDFGMFVFFLLFNLYLLDRGFNEKFLGMIASTMAAGSIAGSIPAGMLARRIGFRRTMLLCFLLIAIISAQRAIFIPPTPQLVLAFLSGVVLSIWAVCISPTIAQLTNEQNRSLGFSLIFASGIGVGAIGAVIGGALPSWLSHLEPHATPAHLKQTALLIACGVVAMAAVPTLGLHFSSSSPPSRKLYPQSGFFYRFLAAIAVWSLVTGALGPFFNVYFARHLQMPVQKIGLVFSSSQLVQVFAVLAAPLIFRRFGLVSGIMYTQLGTGVALACLAAMNGPSSAALVYIIYMSFQWMSEPGMYSLLMGGVNPAERSGASSLNFLTISVSQVLAAAVAGASLVRFGYPAVLLCTACVATVAAVMFHRLLRDTDRSELAAPGREPQMMAAD